MADDRFEVHPRIQVDEPEPTSVPDFGTALLNETRTAKLLEGARGIVGRGVLPDVQLALKEHDHKPNDHVNKDLPGLGKLELVYDGSGQLASTHMVFTDKTVEDTEYHDGHVVRDHLKSSLDATYTFDDQGHVRTESEATSAGTRSYFELAADGTVTHAIDDLGEQGARELDNKPGHHILRYWATDDSVGTLKYDDALHFKSGQIRTPDRLFGIRKGPDGIPVIVPEQEA